MQTGKTSLALDSISTQLLFNGKCYSIYIAVGQKCEKSRFIILWDGENSKNQYTGIQSFLVICYLSKEVWIHLKKLIRNNPDDVSTPRRRCYRTSGKLLIVSNVFFGMKALSYILKHKNNNRNERTMGNFYGNGLMNGSFSRHYKIKLECRRGSGRLFCNESKNAIIPDSNRNGIDLSNNKPLVYEENTKQSIGLKDFDKGMNFDDSLVSTMERIFTFKIHESGKFIELTKNFLTNPKFLQFASYQIKKAKSAHDVLDGINDQ